MSLFEDLNARGLIHQFTEAEVPLAEFLETGSRCVYAGFDPTADSLHVGHLIPLLGLRRFQRAGHKVIALAGGATGLVGDPSGKSAERNMLTREVLAANVAAIKGQLERLLDFGSGSAELVDNVDWTGGLTLLDFLRDVGKHFTINAMTRKDSVKNRIEREGSGISFTEFSYMLLQANDFLHLSRTRGCQIQIGGSDQWGNITCGTELIRRASGGEQHVYGMTMPLLCNSDGSKFGKTAAGAVWLDPDKTSPFAFRQFWHGTTDDDVVQRLLYFTDLPLDEVQALGAEVKTQPYQAQRRLAREMTALVHGESTAEQVERAAAVLFDPKADLREIPLSMMADAFAGAPLVAIPRARFSGDGVPLLDLVVETVHGGAQKRGQARREIEKEACISLNGAKWTDPNATVGASELLHDRYLVVRKGKKQQFLVEATE